MKYVGYMDPANVNCWYFAFVIGNYLRTESNLQNIFIAFKLDNIRNGFIRRSPSTSIRGARKPVSQAKSSSLEYTHYCFVKRYYIKEDCAIGASHAYMSEKSCCELIRFQYIHQLIVIITYTLAHLSQIGVHSSRRIVLRNVPMSHFVFLNCVL